jgi:hypothetical protein
MVVFGGDSGHTLLDDTNVVGFFFLLLFGFGTLHWAVPCYSSVNFIVFILLLIRY